MPDEDPIVAATVLLLVQVPAPVASLRVTVAPIQPLTAPDMAAGNGFTETTAGAEFTVVAVGIQPTLFR